MPQYRLDDALDRIATYVTDVGDAVTETNVDELLGFTNDHGEEYMMRGHRCTAEEHIYLIAGHPELRFVVVAYQYDIRASLADELNDTAVEALIEDSENDFEDEPDANRQMAAVEQLFERAQRRELSDFHYRLARLSSGSETTVDFIGQSLTETRYIVITERLFPYEQRFSIEQFAACRSRVVSLGDTVQSAVGRAVSIERGEAEVPSLRIDTERI
ncbi:hypothetical protein [Halobaculum sp. MBLA0143]|uniref:hypothetical protein n=1 Tax=Halobaculum sp. MBLA0143 TaxID=3079933 RepID=UPI003523BCFB